MKPSPWYILWNRERIPPNNYFFNISPSLDFIVAHVPQFYFSSHTTLSALELVFLLYKCYKNTKHVLFSYGVHHKYKKTKIHTSYNCRLRNKCSALFALCNSYTSNFHLQRSLRSFSIAMNTCHSRISTRDMQLHNLRASTKVEKAFGPLLIKVINS